MKRLLILEEDSSSRLAAVLAEHLSGWKVEAVREPSTGEKMTDAALITEVEKAAGLAASLRQAGMIGPIFALAGPEKIVAPPVVALSKPLRLASLIARLAAPGDAAIDGAVIGAFRFDAGARSLIHMPDERVERLTDKEALVLGLLLRAPRGMSREELQAAAFGYAAGADTHTVETHIWRLRQKLEADPADPHLLTTEGSEYRLVLSPLPSLP